MKCRNIDLGKWSVKKNSFMNVKKIPLFECDTNIESKKYVEFARVLGFLESKNIF